jgi:hypothetical protein
MFVATRAVSGRLSDQFANTLLRTYPLSAMTIPATAPAADLHLRFGLEFADLYRREGLERLDTFLITCQLPTKPHACGTSEDNRAIDASRYVLLLPCRDRTGTGRAGFAPSRTHRCSLKRLFISAGP